MKMIVFLVGKLQNSVNLLHNSKWLIGNVFYGSCLRAPGKRQHSHALGQMLESVCEAFLWLGWMTSNTCFEHFPSQTISVVLYVTEPWGLIRAFFLYWNWPQPDNSGWSCCRDPCNPPHEMLGSWGYLQFSKQMLTGAIFILNLPNWE